MTCSWAIWSEQTTELVRPTRRLGRCCSGGLLHFSFRGSAGSCRFFSGFVEGTLLFCCAGSLCLSRWDGRLSLRCFYLCPFFGVEVADDSGDIRMGLTVWWHTVILLYALWPGIVGSQRLDWIVVIKVEQAAQVSRPCFDIGFGIERITHAQQRCGARHQLHQPLRAFGRDRPRMEVAFSFDHTVDEVRIKLAAHTRLAHYFIQIDCFVRNRLGRRNQICGLRLGHSRLCGRSCRRIFHLERSNLLVQNVNVTVRSIESDCVPELLLADILDGSPIAEYCNLNPQSTKLGSKGHEGYRQWSRESEHLFYLT